MTAQPSATYRHTQKGPWLLVLYAVAVPLLALALWLHQQPNVPPFAVTILAVTGGILVAVGLCFYQLSVADEGDRLAVRFGPVPLFQKRIRYADIVAAEVGRTTLLDGWGIHWSFQGGWVWNIWGWDCVVVRHGGTTFIGTNDAENLAAFLRSKMPVTAGGN
jgi:hypothetical protein